MKVLEWEINLVGTRASRPNNEMELVFGSWNGKLIASLQSKNCSVIFRLCSLNFPAL